MAKQKPKEIRTTNKKKTEGQRDVSAKGFKTEITLPQNKQTINLIFAALISAFIIIAPFYRGLFFRMNYIPAIIIISAIFLLEDGARYRTLELIVMR